MNYFYFYNKKVNEPVKVWKIQLNEFFMLLIGLSIVLVLYAFVVSTFSIGASAMWGFVVIPVIAIAGVIFLRKVNAKNHPSYLLSFISHRFFQPKIIKVSKVKIRTNVFKTQTKEQTGD